MTKHIYKQLAAFALAMGFAFFGFAQTTNTYPFPASGNVGIGTTTPTSSLEIKAAAQAGVERHMKLSVSDAPNDFFTIENITGADGQFSPVVRGQKASDNRVALVILGSLGDESVDNGSNAVVAFDARFVNGKINNRPLFVWQSYSTPYMTMLSDGSLGIGTTTPQAKLAVEGNILAKEIKIKTDISVPDYVFEPDYDLPTLKEIEAYVKEHRHLPEIPSAADIQRDGLDLAEMNLLLLKKVEELTLHLIDKDNEVDELRTEVRSLARLVRELAGTPDSDTSQRTGANQNKPNNTTKNLLP